MSTGRIDTAFNPLVAGGAIWDIALSPDSSRVYLAGYFSSVNGDPEGGDRFAAVSTADGSLVPGLTPFGPNLDATGRQYAVEAVGDLVFVAGEEHMLQVLNAPDLSRNRVYITGSDPDTGVHPLFGGGDFQDLEVIGQRVYASCHCWVSVLDPDTGPELFPTVSPPPGERYPVRSVMAFDGTTGDIVSDFGLDVSGVAGAWAIHGSPDGGLWAGGDLTQSSGTWLQGLGRWCDTTGPTTDTTRPSTPRGLRLTENTPGAITVSWTGSTDDVAVAGYEVYRSADGTLGAYAGTAVTTSFTDTLISPNTTYTYAVKAIDTSANLSWRTNLVTATASDFEDTVRPTTVRGLETLATGTAIDLTWSEASDNVGVTGYRIYRSSNGGSPALVAEATATEWTDTDLTPGTEYTYFVRSVDAAANVGWRSNRSTAVT